jgi:hypothetical protein
MKSYHWKNFSIHFSALFGTKHIIDNAERIPRKVWQVCWTDSVWNLPYGQSEYRLVSSYWNKWNALKQAVVVSKKILTSRRYGPMDTALVFETKDSGFKSL